MEGSVLWLTIPLKILLFSIIITFDMQKSVRKLKEDCFQHLEDNRTFYFFTLFSLNKKRALT